MKASERLLEYIVFETASDGETGKTPSTEEQCNFGKYLCEEMKKIGLRNVRQDEYAYVYGEIPATDESKPNIGFIAHLDTVRDVEFRNIKARVIKDYDGEDIILNAEKNIIMSPKEFGILKNYKGESLIVTDGTTILGADDKAGIAEIITAAERIINGKPFPHGKISVAFTPDEEIGSGADKFDIKGFGADFAFTLDGAACGEVVYETFNAAGARITFTGRNIHPGSAKNKMKNAARIAMEFNSLLPENEKPEYTEKYEGFYHLIDMSGSVESASLTYILRDHDAGKLKEKKERIKTTADFINKKYGDGTVFVMLKDSYKNMAEVLKDRTEITDLAKKAVKEAGATLSVEPIRGGTDGASLSFRGLPCPNLGTGSHNHHGAFEFAVEEEMEKCIDIIMNIVKLAE